MTPRDSVLLSVWNHSSSYPKIQKIGIIIQSLDSFYLFSNSNHFHFLYMLNLNYFTSDFRILSCWTWFFKVNFVELFFWHINSIDLLIFLRLIKQIDASCIPITTFFFLKLFTRIFYVLFCSCVIYALSYFSINVFFRKYLSTSFHHVSTVNDSFIFIYYFRLIFRQLDSDALNCFALLTSK